MSPEQVSGGVLDARTDVYSLGATLYEALTLHRPFEEPTREKLYHAICTQRPADPSKLNPAVEDDLAIVLECALEADRAGATRPRSTSPRTCAASARIEPIRARPVGPLVHVARWARRNPALAAALAAFFLLLVAALGSRSSCSGTRGGSATRRTRRS